jgi:membrane protease YdiL (CAAX protease family)
MASGNDSPYFTATRHPLPCLLFILPMLLGYEGCVLFLGGKHPELLRNGADNWLRIGLAALGVSMSWVPPFLLLLYFGIWSYAKRDGRPQDLASTLSGMGIESVSYALGLWGLSWLITPFFKTAAVAAAASPAKDWNPLLQIVPYVGAGVYEEALFRLVLFTGLAFLLKRIEMLPNLGVMLAALGSATLFSTAHHIGPQGQPYSTYLFVFRLLAGLYFTLLFQLRGFGVAVGAHACYNIMVGISTNG